jgi:ATP-dependent helicase/nuclease subunit A
MSALPVDQEARDRAVDPTGSFHLTAPAGSGKTSVLLERFLTLLGQVEAPEELLALTFTRKAAGELRTRVMDYLAAGPSAGPDLPWEARLKDAGRRALARHGARGEGNLGPERLPIMTFHSFCALLVRQAPQEAGAPLELRLLEELESRRLRQQALEEFRQRLAARPPEDPVRRALLRRLVRLNNDWPRLAGELDDLLARRDTLGEFLELARAAREPGAYQRLLDERLRLLVSENLKTLAAAFKDTSLGQRWEEFYDSLREKGAPLADSLPRQVPGSAFTDLARWREIAFALLTQKGEVRKSLTAQYGFPKDFGHTKWPPLFRLIPEGAARLLRQYRDLAQVTSTPEEVAALQDLVILLGNAISIYEELCLKAGALDFIALEQAALKLLEVEAPGELLLSLDYRLKHLLVDEFQDTSVHQKELLCRLLEGWQPGAGRSLTVVGDPQQSIYGWRQARVRLFEEARTGLRCGETRDYPLTPLSLTTNFRSSRTLIAWANQVFSTILASSAGPEKLEFRRADPGPGTPEGGPPGLALFFGEEGRSPREAEARWLAGQLLQAQDEVKAGESIGVLLFKRTHLPIYQEAFRRAGLAVKVREGLKLGESLGVAHLHNLARALARPHDAAAWAGVLRGPWGPWPLKALAEVALSPEDLWLEKLENFAASPHCSIEWQNLVSALKAAFDQVGRRPLAEIIHQWLDTAGAWPGLALKDGPLGVACARAYLELLALAEAGSPEATFKEAELALEDAYQPPDPRALASPVEIMTVHGAKGLEFDRVFIPGLDWQPLQGESKTPPFLLEEIPGTRLHGLALARPYAHEKHSSLYTLLGNLKGRRILAEARRVFYVGATRARQSLTLSGVVKVNRQGHTSVPPESPLGWLLSHYSLEDRLLRPERLWPQPELRVEFFNEVPPPPPRESGPPPLSEVWEVAPEAPPYQLKFPSQMAPEGEPGGVSGEAEEFEVKDGKAGPDLVPRVRGEVTHRLLEALSRGEPLPPAPGVAAALRQGGLEAAAALELSREILEEVAACLQDPFLAGLLNSELPFSRSEWRLEARPAPGLLYRGKIDRMAFDGRNFWLIDYKTSRPAPGEPWEVFITREKEKYRPQLQAYREMAAPARGLDPESVGLVLYFTAIQRAVEV